MNKIFTCLHDTSSELTDFPTVHLHDLKLVQTGYVKRSRVGQFKTQPGKKSATRSYVKIIFKRSSTDKKDRKIKTFFIMQKLPTHYRGHSSTESAL